MIAALRRSGLEVIGHGHPRYQTFFRRLWAGLGVEWVGDFAEVVQRADVYVCDNSSTQAESAACGIPQVILSAPWYRREIESWPRFWRAVDMGIHVEHRADLVESILLALDDPLEIAARRREVVAEVTPMLDGHGAERAAAAIRTLVASASVA